MPALHFLCLTVSSGGGGNLTCSTLTFCPTGTIPGTCIVDICLTNVLWINLSRSLSIFTLVDIAFNVLPQTRALLRMFSSVESLSCVWLFATPWTAALQASLSITSSWSPPTPLFIESVMPSSHLILCRPLLLLPSIFPIVKVFSNESALHIR